MKESIDKAMELLEVLATKLGTTAEHLWGVLVAQQKIMVLSDSLVVGLYLTLFIICLIITKRRWKWFNGFAMERVSYTGATYIDTEGATIAKGFACIITAIAGFVFFVMLGDLLYNTPIRLLNPEYEALAKVLSIIGH